MAVRQLSKLRFAASAGNLKMVRDEVARAVRAVGYDQKVVNEAVIAVNEVCMNIIQHGYRRDPNGEIILQVLHDEDASELVFQLQDFAETVEPAKVCPRQLDDLRPGGLGTHFIRELMDEFVICAGPGHKGNIWRMSKVIH